MLCNQLNNAVDLVFVMSHISRKSFNKCFILNSQDLYGVRSDLGNLFKALGRLEDAKVRHTYRQTVWLAGGVIDNEFMTGGTGGIV